jgi:hypothetical protein
MLIKKRDGHNDNITTLGKERGWKIFKVTWLTERGTELQILKAEQIYIMKSETNW